MCTRMNYLLVPGARTYAKFVRPRRIVRSPVRNNKQTAIHAKSYVARCVCIRHLTAVRVGRLHCRPRIAGFSPNPHKKRYIISTDFQIDKETHIREPIGFEAHERQNYTAARNPACSAVYTKSDKRRRVRVK